MERSHIDRPTSQLELSARRLAAWEPFAGMGMCEEHTVHTGRRPC
jgi:hypothetical protein